MFPPNFNKSKYLPLMMKNHMGANPMGFNPFEYHNHVMQENNPFKSDFFMPKQQMHGPQGQYQPFQQQSTPYSQANQGPQFPFNQTFQQFPFNQGFPVQQGNAPLGPTSFIRDQNGKIDYKKIGNGVQSVMGFVGQVNPVMKLLGGFLK
ncbi:hypothetical protein [Bacillus alkalicellulosilyticus]|uniref:hypothetical protein n=1 Tax=Alkalihalobacterium alkalicellulosilyticum TaxID=1912214 RepID=UPI0009969AC3|nr:hypothetical protein [Bacillus alkalicellulosilyticus]